MKNEKGKKGGDLEQDQLGKPGEAVKREEWERNMAGGLTGRPSHIEDNKKRTPSASKQGGTERSRCENGSGSGNLKRRTLVHFKEGRTGGGRDSRGREKAGGRNFAEGPSVEVGGTGDEKGNQIYLDPSKEINTKRQRTRKDAGRGGNGGGRKIKRLRPVTVCGNHEQKKARGKRSF